MASPEESTFRERQVQQRLRKHDGRLSRLEKGALVALGYAFAEGANIIDAFVALVL